MTEGLKPCPFCGGEAHIEKLPTLAMLSPSQTIEGMSGGELAETGEYRYFVYCSKCGNFCKRIGYTGKATKPFENQSEAAAAWNRRADDANETGI